MIGPQGFVAVVELAGPDEAVRLHQALIAATAGAKRPPVLPDLLYLRVPGVTRWTLPCRLRRKQRAGGSPFIELLYPKVRPQPQIDARLIASGDEIMRMPRPGGPEIAVEVDRAAFDESRKQPRPRGERPYLVDILPTLPAKRVMVRSGTVFGWRDATAEELQAWLVNGVLVGEIVERQGFTVHRFIHSDNGLQSALDQRAKGDMLDLAVEQIVAAATERRGGRPDYQARIDAVGRRDRRLDTQGGTKLPQILPQLLTTAPGRSGPDAPSSLEVTMSTHEIEEDRHGETQLRFGLDYRRILDHGGKKQEGRALGPLSELGDAAAIVRGSGKGREWLLGIEVRAELKERAKKRGKRKPLDDPRQLVLWSTEAEQVAQRDLVVIDRDQRRGMKEQDRLVRLQDAALDLMRDYGVQTIQVGAAVFQLWRKAIEKDKEVRAITVDRDTVARVLGFEPHAMNDRMRKGIDQQLRLLTAMTLPVRLGMFNMKHWTWHGRILTVQEFIRSEDGETVYKLSPADRWKDDRRFLWVPDELLQLDLGRHELEFRLGWIICREFSRGYGNKVMSEAAGKLRELHRKLGWMLAEAGDMTIQRTIEDQSRAAAKARIVRAVEMLEGIGLDMVIEWNEDSLLDSICRPIVSERLSLVHEQLSGARLRRAQLTLTKKPKAQAKAAPPG